MRMRVNWFFLAVLNRAYTSESPKNHPFRDDEEKHTNKWKQKHVSTISSHNAHVEWNGMLVGWNGMGWVESFYLFNKHIFVLECLYNVSASNTFGLIIKYVYMNTNTYGWVCSEKRDTEREKNNIDWHLLIWFFYHVLSTSLSHVVSLASIVLIPVNALFACLLACLGGWFVCLVVCLFIYSFVVVVVILFPFFAALHPPTHFVLSTHRDDATKMLFSCYSFTRSEWNGMEIARK